MPADPNVQQHLSTAVAEFLDQNGVERTTKMLAFLLAGMAATHDLKLEYEFAIGLVIVKPGPPRSQTVH